jgi:peroxiredoxin
MTQSYVWTSFVLMTVLVFTASATAAYAAGSGTKAGEEATEELPSLQEELDKKRKAFDEAAPPEMKKTFADGIELVAQSGVLDTALKEGDKAPDFTLPADDGAEVTLSKLLAEGPAVLTWYRGGWCPYCNIELQALNRALPRIQKAGGSLVAISPETLPNTKETTEQSTLGFPVLSDEDNRVAKKYGIVYTLPGPVAEAFKGRIDLAKYHGNEKNELPLAVTYVVDTAQVIRYAFVDADYKKRAEPAEIVAVLEALKKAQ